MKGNAALLILDIQNDFCHEEGKFSKMGMSVKKVQEMVPRLIEFIEIARKHNIPIFYSKQIESDNVSPKNLKNQFGSGRLKPVCAPDSWGSELYKLKPLPSEHVIEKHTYDFFSNEKLKQLLNKQDVDTLIITGVNTDICVDTTLRSAFTLGYNIIIPEDLVASINQDTHKQLLRIFHQFFGEVVRSSDVFDS